MPPKRPQRNKALLALAFAGTVFNSQLPSLADGTTESTDLVIQQIANSKSLTPESRAYYLLKLASGYLSGGDQSAVEAPYRAVNGSQNLPFSRSRMENILVTWADDVSSIRLAPNQKSDAAKKPKSKIQPPDAYSDLADAAVQKAVIQLEHSSETFAKLNMYFIASRLFQRLGDTDGMNRCNLILEKAFQSGERGTPIDEEQTRAVVSILSSMANGLIAVHIPLQNPHEAPAGPAVTMKPFTEKEFKESEKLRLRAVAIADRLGTQNHVRRKAHRDMSLWYSQLGKRQLAEAEKQTLFELVGLKDDKILYPQAEACGHLVWWTKETNVAAYDCGRG